MYSDAFLSIMVAITIPSMLLPVNAKCMNIWMINWLREVQIWGFAVKKLDCSVANGMGVFVGRFGSLYNDTMVLLPCITLMYSLPIYNFSGQIPKDAKFIVHSGVTTMQQVLYISWTYM